MKVESNTRQNTRPAIKITHAALAEFGDGGIILRGVIDPSSLASLQVDSYQREVQGRKHIRQIIKGVAKRGGVPDVELGMRGHSFTEADGDFFLNDGVYIIDGLQRTTAALEVLQNGTQPHIGAMIHFDTTYEWEKSRFELLNMHRSSVSANVLIRNMEKDNKSIALLLQLCNSSSFVLANRVSWTQRMGRDKLIKGQVLLKVVAQLHKRYAAGLCNTRYTEVAAGLLKVYGKVGHNTMRENIKGYFDLIDQCFNIRDIAYTSAAPYLKYGFLKTLARVIADHQDFWDDSALNVSSDLRRKMGLFKINDPMISALCGSSGAGQKRLYDYIVDHINSGKRSRRLTPFVAPEFIIEEEDDDEENSGEEMAPMSLIVGSDVVFSQTSVRR